jgi:cellulose biosynthesis protein BcsQ
MPEPENGDSESLRDIFEEVSLLEARMELQLQMMSVLIARQQARDRQDRSRIIQCASTFRIQRRAA